MAALRERLSDAEIESSRPKVRRGQKVGVEEALKV